MKIVPKAELELRKWCIEMAIKWQWSAPFYPSNNGVYPMPDREAAEPDTLGRAEKIYNWINKKGNRNG